MKSITVLINARKNSTRCYNKLLRPFCDTTLFDIAVSKLVQLKRVDRVVGAYEDEFICKCKSYPEIDVVQRSYESVCVDLPLSVVFEAVKHMTSSHFMFLNASCAHISVETLQSAIDLFLGESYISLTSVVETSDWIFDADGMPITHIGNGDTKTSSKLYRVAHAFHIVDLQRFLDSELIWSGVRKEDPYLFAIPVEESLDIDTEFEFELSELMYCRNARKLV